MWKKLVKTIVIAVIIIIALSACGKIDVNTIPPHSPVLNTYWDVWPYNVRLFFVDGAGTPGEGETPVTFTQNTVSFEYKGTKHHGVLVNGDNTLVGIWGGYIGIVLDLPDWDFLLRIWKADRVETSEPGTGNRELEK